MQFTVSRATILLSLIASAVGTPVQKRSIPALQGWSWPNFQVSLLEFQEILFFFFGKLSTETALQSVESLNMRITLTKVDHQGTLEYQTFCAPGFCCFASKSDAQGSPQPVVVEVGSLSVLDASVLLKNTSTVSIWDAWDCSGSVSQPICAALVRFSASSCRCHNFPHISWVIWL